VTAFSTSSSSATLPAALTACRERLNIAASTAGFVYLVERLRKKNRTAPFVLAIGVTSLQAYVVAHNYSIARR
jgi:DAACS family dicarboxylate/amino acid:cation (Na+ or H+) symporter